MTDQKKNITMDYYRFDNIEELFALYKNQISLINRVVHDNKNILNYVPEINNAWSIKDHLIHICETEINCFIRLRKSIQNPGTVIDFGGGDINLVNVLLNYKSADLNLFICLFETLRKIILAEMKDFSNEKINNYWITHPDFGRCDIQFILSIYTQHFNKHIEFIKRNIDENKKHNN